MPNYNNPLNVTRTNAINQTPEQNAAMFAVANSVPQNNNSQQNYVPGKIITLGNTNYYVSNNTLVFTSYTAKKQ